MKHQILTQWSCMLFIISVNGTFDPVRDQLVLYKERTKERTRLTTSDGAPVESQDLSTLNKRLIYNNYFMDSLTHLNREKIPHRIVHAKGAGAFGYFEVTNNVTEYIKADFLSDIGKKTPVAARFSPAAGEPGVSDSIRAMRGFAVKFYTKEGNFDFVGITTSQFAFKDPVLFPGFTHALGNNPSTNIPDSNMQWDFLTRHPETLSFIMKVLSDDGIPKGYRHMRGYSIHTYQIQNKYGKIYFARFIFTPDDGKASLTSEEAQKLDSSDPDSFTRDLYEAIACEKRVSWTFNMQLITYEQAFNSDIDVFDPSLELPVDDFPLTPIGKLVLDRNPVNYFADVEQLAFCPCNLVPGIDGGPDKLFEARAFAYRDTQLYRLGVNVNKIKVNCPFETVARTYQRDGVAPVLDNGGDAPNYYENSFNGPMPYNDVNRTRLIQIFERKANNFDQAALIYLDMSEEEQNRLVDNIVASLGPTIPFLQERAIDIFSEIEADLGERIRNGLKEFPRQPICNIDFDEHTNED